MYRKVNKEKDETGYSVLAEMLKEQMEKDDEWIHGSYVLVYFKQKYEWEDKYDNEMTVAEIDVHDVECWENDFYEGQDDYILVGYTFTEELYDAEPIHKVED